MTRHGVRVGLALDPRGFYRGRPGSGAGGLFLFVYNDPDAQSRKGGLGRLAFWRDDEAVDTQYHIRVIGADEVSEVRVQDAEGETLATSTASRILALLQDELK